MDIIRNTINNPIVINKDNSFKHEAPLNAIEELIKQLENINLSPLPSNKEQISIHKSISSILKKVIYNFDVILNEKLKKRSEISKSSNTLNNEESHYWNYISKYFQLPSVKFINNIYDKLNTDADKGIAWIYISITEKSFSESVKEIYNQNFDKKFYEIDSLVHKNKNDILFLSEKICKFLFFNIKLEIEDEYNLYKQQKENERKEIEQSDIELPSVSPINTSDRKKSINTYITPYNLDIRENRGSQNFYYSKATIDFNISTLHSRADGFNLEKSTKTIDNLFSIINREDEESILQNTENNDEDDIEFIREKSYAKNTQIIYYNVNKENNNGTVNLNLENHTNMKHSDKIKDSSEKNFNVCKYFDFSVCYKDDYFLTLFEGRSNSNKTSPTKKSPNQTLNNNTMSITTTPMKLQYITNTYDNKPLIPSFNNLQTPFDKKFRISRKVDKNQFTKKDIIFYNNKELKMTNSIVFYLNHFYSKVPYIKFNTQINNDQPITLASQNHQCQFCLKKFSTFMHIPLSKVYWCSYYMRFICQDCASDEYSIVPAFVLKHWNFKKFQISNTAKELITLWYDKPVIHIKQNDPIIKESSLLYSAILLKRKIHKIFDLMKCEGLETFVFNTLKEYKYLVLRETLFSLKDLVDISEFKLIKLLKEILVKFEDHILRECADCKYTGGTCMMCMTDEVLFAYDVETVLFCNECKKMFHKKCCSFHPCIINR